MTEEITEIATPEQIANELEEQREDIKTKLGLDDEAFDILIKDTILASYAELSIRIKPDDPIFAVILSQKKVMNYYTKIIAEALKVTPISSIRKLMNLKNLLLHLEHLLMSFTMNFLPIYKINHSKSITQSLQPLINSSIKKSKKSKKLHKQTINKLISFFYF